MYPLKKRKHGETRLLGVVPGLEWQARRGSRCERRDELRSRPRAGEHTASMDDPRDKCAESCGPSTKCFDGLRAAQHFYGHSSAQSLRQSRWGQASHCPERVLWRGNGHGTAWLSGQDAAVLSHGTAASGDASAQCHDCGEYDGHDESDGAHGPRSYARRAVCSAGARMD
eukprot:scaffold429_cov269-Pinguiococcus_pyrenoidosus.AAC.17